MERAKIGICFRDEEYLERFVRCWMHHFEHRYELSVASSLENITHPMNHDEIILLEGVEAEEIELICREKMQVFVLTEDDFIYENCIVLDKYQEIYKIEQQIGVHLSNIEETCHGRSKVQNKIGVFSLDATSAQLPFGAMLATEYAQGNRCLLVNLQMASGLEAEKELTMEELLMAAVTGNYTRAQLQDAIVQECGWDYVCPVKNTEYLVETNKSLYETLFHILSKELGYDTYIINFGQMFEGCMDMMNLCDKFYFLVPQKSCKTRREKAFIQELSQYGLEKLLDEMIFIEISGGYQANEPWRRLAEKWRWNEIGDQVRETI